MSNPWNDADRRRVWESGGDPDDPFEYSQQYPDWYEDMLTALDNRALWRAD